MMLQVELWYFNIWQSMVSYTVFSVCTCTISDYVLFFLIFSGSKYHLPSGWSGVHCKWDWPSDIHLFSHWYPTTSQYHLDKEWSSSRWKCRLTNQSWQSLWFSTSSNSWWKYLLCQSQSDHQQHQGQWLWYLHLCSLQWECDDTQCDSKLYTGSAG